MAKTILILLQIVLLANVLLAQSCSRKKCNSCSGSGSNGRRGISASSGSCEFSVVPCYQINDLAIVIDSSGSIGSDNYVTVKSFVEKLAAGFTVEIKSRISIILFSNTATILVPLTNTLSPAEITSKILNIVYSGGSTSTDLGIYASIAQFDSSPRQVPLNLVVLTDGESNDRSLTVSAANTAETKGIRTFSVGIGTLINNQELLDIAGGHVDRVYTLSNFDELIKVLNPLSRAICAN